MMYFMKVYLAMAEVILGQATENNKSIYLLLNSVVPLVVSIIVLPLLRDSKCVVGTQKLFGLVCMFFLAVLTGAYAIAETTIPELDTLPRRVPMVVLLAMILLISLVPFVLKARYDIRLRNKVASPKTPELAEKRTVEEEVEQQQEVTVRDEVRVEREGRGERREYGFWDLVKNLNFWIYFVVYACGGALGLVYANNLGQIAQSRGVSEAVLVSISSSFNFFGKLGSAPLSALAYRKRKLVVPPTASLFLLMVPMAISFFLLLNPSKFCLFAGTAVIGMSTGAITSLTISITAELFGFKHFGINHNIVVANIPIGSFLFGYMAARIYDSKSGVNGGSGDSKIVCTGIKCFHQTFIIWGFICALGTLLSFVLYYRTRKHLQVINQTES